MMVNIMIRHDEWTKSIYEDKRKKFKHFEAVKRVCRKLIKVLYGLIKYVDLEELEHKNVWTIIEIKHLLEEKMVSI